MSDPQPTSQMGDWLSENLPEWLHLPHSHNKLHKFINETVLPHISSTGVHSMYEFIEEDYDNHELPFYNFGGTNGDD